ncbi:MAG: translation elongation factor Ts [Acidobacteriota bacterium]
MEIPAALVKELREKTSAGMMECKAALQEAEGDLEKAVTILRKRGLASAARKAGRTTSEGIVSAYIHPGGKIGVLVELNCETDFVARTDDFQQLVKDVAMHIAATDPKYVRRDEVTEDILERERDVYREQARQSGKPEAILAKIVEGKVSRYFAENCLYDQSFVKNPDTTVKEHIDSKIATIKENISVKRFVRYKIGE